MSSELWINPRTAIEALQDTIGSQQDRAIQTQQAEIEELRKRPALAQQMEHPPRDWRKLGECQKVMIIQRSPWCGVYRAVAVNGEGLLAVTDGANKCVHLLNKYGKLMQSIGKQAVLGLLLYGVAFDLKGNVWVTDWGNNKVVKLSQNGQLLHTIHHTGSEREHFSKPGVVSVSPNGLVYICDEGNHRVTVHDEDGKFLLTFGSEGSGPGCFNRPCGIAFGSDGLVYVVDDGNNRVCAWSKEGTFKRDFMTRYAPYYIAASNDNYLLITSYSSHTIMVYRLDGELISQFGAEGSDANKFNCPFGICVDDTGLVYVVDSKNDRVQVF